MLPTILHHKPDWSTGGDGNMWDYSGILQTTEGITDTAFLTLLTILRVLHMSSNYLEPHGFSVRRIAIIGTGPSSLAAAK